MTAPITPDERAAMRALADAATDGPWEVYSARGGTYVTRPDLLGVAREWSLVWQVADARFIAAARTAVPRLLDALDTAEAERDAVRTNALAQVLAANRAVEKAHARARRRKVERDDALAKRYRERVWTLDARLAALGYPKCTCHPADDDSERCLPDPETWTRPARPAPVWDEDTVTEAADEYARHNMGMRVGTYGDQLRCAFEVGATWQREHLPVSGESRATVQAEALRDAADEFFEKSPDTSLETMPSQDGHRYVTTHAWLRARADRLDPKEADRG